LSRGETTGGGAVASFASSFLVLGQGSELDAKRPCRVMTDGVA
jgi:hypothetical protein